MPAQSQQQQKLFGLALAFKRGEVPSSEVSDEIKAITDRMSEKEIEDFASTKHKGLPKMKEQLRKIVREILREKVISEMELSKDEMDKLHSDGEVEVDGEKVTYDESVNEEKPGLWANIRAKRARGEKPAHGNSQAHKDAVKAGKKINNEESVVSEAKFGYKDSTASYINNHKDEFKVAEKMNKGNEVKFYDALSQMEEKIGHPKFMIFLSNALRGYKVDMYKDPKIKNPQDAQEALFLLSK